MENKTSVTTLEKPSLPTEIISKEKIIDYLQAFGFVNSLSKNECSQFTEIAVAYQLNPFKREIYCIPYNGKEGKKLSIITGYEVYLKRAERLNNLDGWKCWVEGEGPKMVAKIMIYRKDWTRPFEHEVEFSEYNQNNRMWNSKPKTMIKKVCTAQGFRLCFPDEMGGMPYTSEELPDDMTGYEERPLKQAQPITGNHQAEPVTDNPDYMIELEAFFQADNTNATQREAIVEAVNKKKPEDRAKLIKSIIAKREAIKNFDGLVLALKHEFQDEWIDVKEKCKTIENYLAATERLRDAIYQNPGMRKEVKLDAPAAQPVTAVDETKQEEELNLFY